MNFACLVQMNKSRDFRRPWKPQKNTRGLGSYMEQWLKELDFLIVSPKPFSSLTKTTYNDELTMKSSKQRIIRELTNTFNRQIQYLHDTDVAPNKLTSSLIGNVLNFLPGCHEGGDQGRFKATVAWASYIV